LRPAARAAAAIVALFATAAAAQAPAPTPTPLTLGIEVDVVSLTAVIHDRAGRFVKGLGPADVTVLEDGVRQEVTYFREASAAAAAGERIPLSVVLVLDTSGSMGRNLSFLQEAASSFLAKLEPGDRALVVQFNETVKSSVDFTEDLDRLENFVDSLQSWGATSLYDAIQYALVRVRDESGRKAVVVFSDGADTSSQADEDDVVALARAVEATVYSVGIRSGAGLQARSPRGFLRKIARETGGLFFFPERVGDLIKTFAAISAELKAHYLLAYSPTKAPDSLFREITLKVARPDVEVRVRKGYFAVRKRPRN
jgi:Ca-activated chloride channel family protein